MEEVSRLGAEGERIPRGLEAPEVGHLYPIEQHRVIGSGLVDGDGIGPGVELPLVYVDYDPVFALPLPAPLSSQIDGGAIDGELDPVGLILCGAPQGNRHGGRPR